MARDTLSENGGFAMKKSGGEKWGNLAHTRRVALPQTMTVKDDDKMPIGHNSSLLQRFHEAWDRLEGIGATLGEDGGEGGGESPVIGHYVLLCGAGCCLWARGFSGHRARL